MNIRSIYKFFVFFILGFFLWLGCISCNNQSTASNNIDLQFYAVVNPYPDIEVSGLVKSRIHENVFWIHGDSGDEAAIFPINKEGEIISSAFESGIGLVGTENEDWEDIATDASGNLYIGDIGNNCHCRHDMMILQLPEPNLESNKIEQTRKLRLEYPAELAADSQHNLPDAEALFFQNGNVYILTKESGGKGTRLLKMHDPDPSTLNVLELVQTLDLDDKVTAADISVSGDSIAVLTSSSVWLLTDFTNDDFFSGNIQRVFFEATQVESIAFSGEGSVLIAEETGELYEIPLSKFD